VLVLEKRHLVGGAAVTEELISGTPLRCGLYSPVGYKFSRCSYLAGLLRPIIYEELELKKYGVKFYLRDPNAFTPLLDGRYLLLGMSFYGSSIHDLLARF
jgi:phytoene dehydrogenase-like protein